jgi:ribosomal protein S18 acetylase RimI-like enzyme
MLMKLSAKPRGELLRWARLPKCMGDHELQLRPLSIFDMLFLKSAVTVAEQPKTGKMGMSLHSSGLAMWWRLKRASVCCYCVLLRSRRIGWLGLHNLRLGESVELSLAILEPTLRGCGYGTRALHLLADSLGRHCVAQELWVQVRTANAAAVRFWEKHGFVTVQEIDSILMLSKLLTGGNERG